MKRVALLLAMSLLLFGTASAKENDPCASSSDCDIGEWCEAFRCKYYPCSTDADCPECGKCAGGACFRDGGCIPSGESGVDPADLIAPMQPVEPIEGGTGPGGSMAGMDTTTLLLGVIAVMAVAIIVLAVRRR